MTKTSSSFTERLGIKYPLIGGAMYPCSNPELVAAVSAAGGLGIVQPVSLTYVHGYDFREGLRFIRRLTDRPIGLNLLIEKSSERYRKKNEEWLEIALEEGLRFFVTALGNPSWVTQRIAGTGSQGFHNTTERRWAEKALAAGVHGLICVNDRAGGHAGPLSPEALFRELESLQVPLICAGGIGDRAQYRKALALGYAGVQLGTRFIASRECSAHPDYKQAIVDADEDAIILTKKLTGVNVAVIGSNHQGLGQLSAWEEALLRHPRTKHWARSFYGLRSLWSLKRGLKQSAKQEPLYQAGKSVSGITAVMSVAEIVEQLTLSE